MELLGPIIDVSIGTGSDKKMTFLVHQYDNGGGDVGDWEVTVERKNKRKVN